MDNYMNGDKKKKKRISIQKKKNILYVSKYLLYI